MVVTAAGVSPAPRNFAVGGVLVCQCRQQAGDYGCGQELQLQADSKATLQLGNSYTGACWTPTGRTATSCSRLGHHRQCRQGEQRDAWQAGLTALKCRVGDGHWLGWHAHNHQCACTDTRAMIA